MRKLIFILVLMYVGLTSAYAAGGSEIALKQAPISARDKASLQRGAKWYMNYCSGCHSLKYQRYQRMAKDIGIVDHYGDVLVPLVKENLIFTGAKIRDPILSAIAIDDAKKWFGVAPPDLSLTVRQRGADWLYTYLTSFYDDDSRPWGSNNLLFPEVGMPNVLEALQGVRVPVYETKTVQYNGVTKEIKVIDHLQLIEEGEMSERQFNLMVADLVNFLSYVSEPMRLERIWLGIWVLGFILILAVLAYLLKKEYWKKLK